MRLPIIGRILFLLPVLLLPSTRNIWKNFDSPWYIFGIFAILLVVFLYSLFWLNEANGFVHKVINSKWMLYGLAGLTVAAGYVLYSHVDGLGMGSTSDDALMLPIQALVAGRNPYAVTLFDGAPISPGPGWLALNIPFGFSILHPWLTPVYFIACIHICSRLNGENINIPILLCMASPIFWSLVGSGSDLVALGFALLLSFLLVERYLTSNASVVWLSLLVGSIATARIIFSPLPALIGLLFSKRNVMLSIRFAFLGICINFLWHLVFYSISSRYQPLHLIGRGVNHVGFDLMAIGGIGILLLAGVIVRNCGDSFSQRLQWFSGCLVLVLGVVALGELRAVHYNFALWEGASYLYVAAPAVVFAVCMRRPFARDVIG